MSKISYSEQFPTHTEVLTELEAATYIGMSRSFLSQDRMNGIRKRRTQGPAFLKIGRHVRYLKGDLDSWLSQHRILRGT